MSTNVRSLLVGLCAAAAATVLTLAAPQQTPPAAPTGSTSAPSPKESAASPQPTFRSGVELVNLSLTVTDRRGRSVNDLKQEDFLVAEDGKPQEIVSFRGVKEASATPIGLGLVIDASASMTPDRLGTMRTAVEIMLSERMRKGDEFYFVEFASDVRLIKPWTTDRRGVVDAIYRIKTRLGTAIYNALMTALDVSKTGKHKKQVILVITDGEDTHSTVAREAVATAARSSEVVIYALVMDREEGLGRGAGGASTTVRQAALELSQVTDATGGRTVYAQGFQQLEGAIDDMGKEFTQQYEIAYARGPADNRYHEVTVGVRNRQDITVRHRRGYLAR